MLPLEEAKKFKKQVKSLQVYLDRSIKEGSTILLDYLQKLKLTRVFYINCALDIARGERQLGFSVETGDVGILLLYAAKVKIQKECHTIKIGLILFQAIRKLKFKSEKENK